MSLVAKGLRVNARKTKVMINIGDRGVISEYVAWPYVVCSKGVPAKSLLRMYTKWVYRSGRGVKGSL